jgi:RalA-binding protein 1
MLRDTSSGSAFDSSPADHPSPSPSLADSIRQLRDQTRAQNVPATLAGARRKAAPNPLAPSAASSNGPPPYHQEPRSPREKLDLLLAEEELHTSTPRAVHPLTPPTTHPVPASKSSEPRPPAIRHVSSPTLSSAGLSPPASPPAMPPPSRPHRPETKPAALVRSPSMDSAASSMSSGASQRAPLGHAPRPSQDTSLANPPNMAALVAAAGSPEAAMMSLWREKQSTATHNAQLWRLVEKQRSMVIGLQKDLERALKDKDRYRRKFRELNEQAPPVPGALQRSDTLASVEERESSQSPAFSERPGESTRSGDSKSSPLTQQHAAPLPIPDAMLASSPSHSETHTASSMNSPTDLSVQPLHFGNRGLGLDTVMQDSSVHVQPPQEPPAADSPPTKVTPPPNQSQLQPPELSLTQATPVVGGNGFESPPRKPTAPFRKAPPAPLNLSKPMTTSAHLHQATRDDVDDSDYDDTLEVDEIPIIDQRGRRKTREDDDRVREALAVNNEQARSKSKKKKSESKSGQTPDNAEAMTSPPSQDQAPPLSPRQFTALAPGLPLSPRHPPAGSLNAMLSPTNSDSSMMANRSVASYGSPLLSPPLLSPGLPSSPRPTDRPLGSPLPRIPKQSVASPPMSPTAMVHPATRTLQQQVPLLPNTPQSYQSSAAVQTNSMPSSSLLSVPGAQPSPDSSSSSPTLNDVPDAEHVYRGLMSDNYPGLLLPPNALPSIEVKVFSSRLRPSRLSFLAPKPQEEDPVFILAIYSRSDNKQLWRVEKTIATLPALDSQLKSLCDLQARLPDRAIFGGHAPAKIDARRVALNQYFDTILETPMSEKAAMIVCGYISADVMGAQAGDRLNPQPTLAPVEVAPKTRQQKEGYLTKRGKNFGGWKARFFVLDGPEFRYYEVEGGAHLGTIKLYNAQIGKQSQQQSNQSPQRRDETEDNQYRHAFLILEPKRKDSSSLVRHVLCAENDEERDAWVDALLQHVDLPDDSSPVEIPVPAVQRLQKMQPSQDSMRSARDSPDVETQNRLQGLSYDDTIAAEAPMRGPQIQVTGGQQSRGSPKGSAFAQDGSGHYPAISGPSNGAPIRDVEFWGNKSSAGPTSVKDKKRSIFGFRGRGGSSDLAPVQVNNNNQSSQSLNQSEYRAPPPNRSIFGIPLQEAVEYSKPQGVQAPLPAVFYRCLEYLHEKKAINEEGIFRLSGSNIVIKSLRERFNTEGDIKLLDGQYYDVHAVASLLKLYLRELPASVLTRELHLDFLKVLGKSNVCCAFFQ